MITSCRPRSLRPRGEQQSRALRRPQRSPRAVGVRAHARGWATIDYLQVQRVVAKGPGQEIHRGRALDRSQGPDSDRLELRSSTIGPGA